MTSPSFPSDSNNHVPLNQRDAWIELDLACLEKNVQILKLRLKQNAETAGVAIPQIMAVVKASAYGHGAVAIAKVLAGCNISWLAVASVDEGSELRKAGCKLPILILGPTPLWAVPNALKQSLDLTISSLNQLNELDQLAANYERRVSVHLKVDTGMHRLGMNKSHAEKAIAIFKKNKKLKLVSVFSHLAIATDLQVTKKQKENFDNFIVLFKENNCQPDFYHLAGSEAIKDFPFSYYDFVRVGLHLYGMEPDNSMAQQASPLLPIMSVRGRINQINIIEKGETVGYGLTWRAERLTRLANIPIGYADGIDRRLSNKMNGFLHGKLIKQVGTISMDQMLFDITDIPSAKEGDIITLIGKEEITASEGSSVSTKCLYITDWANQLGTMVRELSCRLNMRLPRIYTRGQMLRHLEGDRL